jgi:hypothetical protein
VNANTLAYWRWRLHTERRAGGRAARSAGRAKDATAGEALRRVEFVELPGLLTRATVPAAAEPFEVVLPGGTTVRVPATFRAPCLRRLLAVVEGR